MKPTKFSNKQTYAFKFKIFALIIAIASASLASGCILRKKHPDEKQPPKKVKMK